ncbi:hypothetical protein KIN20_028136 [Parelaphostrongylus tenuis]|nr:hypothetical protein KIN20_028136 [Parelaphostrongylus tenuis]
MAWLFPPFASEGSTLKISVSNYDHKARGLRPLRSTFDEFNFLELLHTVCPTNASRLLFIVVRRAGVANRVFEVS